VQIPSSPSGGRESPRMLAAAVPLPDTDWLDLEPHAIALELTRLDFMDYKRVLVRFSLPSILLSLSLPSISYAMS
jgi:hypothetical protein